MSSEFYEITQERPPSQILSTAVSLLQNKGKALDLGCGAGADTNFLAKQMNQFTAVDANPKTQEYIGKLSNQEKIKYINSTFEDFLFDEKYDLVNARFALPFTPPEHFDEVFTKMKDSINSNGIFVGQLFGDNDEWNKEGVNMTFHSREEIEKYLKDMEVIDIKEVDEDGKLANGTPKHWHIFHIIARKPISDSQTSF